MRAMILAAGYGTRLWPLTLDRGKSAVPFLNRPLIAYSLDYLQRFGIDQLIVNLHHKPETVRAAVEQHAPSDLNVHFSLETDILGTGGALDKVRSRLRDGTFVVINGKIVTDIDLSAALDAHRRQSALATLVLRPNANRDRFSQVEIDARGRISGFAGFPTPAGEAPAGGPPDPPLLFTGIQILEPGIFEFIPPGRFSHTTTEVYPRAIAGKKTIAAHIDDRPWYELSTLERYLEAQLEFLHRRGQCRICGPHTTIEDGADVADSILWSGVRVMRGARLRRCIVGDGVTIWDEAGFEQVAIVRAELCPRPERGDIIGENLIVPF